MADPIDPLTSALTGHLTFHLLFAAALTWPTALAVLALYKRAVRRSMHGHAGCRPAEVPPASHPVGGQSALLHDLPDASTGKAAEQLLSQLIARPRHAALVYLIAGAAYGLVMAPASLFSDGLEILPVRFTFVFWMYFWPVVLTIGIVATTTRRARFGLAAIYLMVLVIIGAIGISTSPEVTWPQVFTPWLIADLPPTILLVTYLSRRVRAVGPLILPVLVFALIGSDVAVTIAGSQERYLRAIITLTSTVGLGARGTLNALLLAGFVTFAVIGGAVLAWVGRRYQTKKISDESINVDAIWILFTILFSMDFVFRGPWWALVGPFAFAVYKMTTRVGFALLARAQAAPQRVPALLVLRSFSIGKDDERLFDFIDRIWRRVGSGWCSSSIAVPTKPCWHKRSASAALVCTVSRR